MSDTPHDVTNGELFRLVDGLKQEFREATRKQNETLDTIEAQVRATNGQVMRHDGRLTNLEREVFDRRTFATTAAQKGTISFDWSPDVKTVMAILGAAATVIGLLIKGWTL